MIEAKELVLIWCGSKQKMVSKQRIIEILLESNINRRYSKSIIVGNQEYHGIYDCILREMDNINIIQIYEDGVVRVHLNHRPYEEPKNIVFDVLEETEKLRSFVNWWLS